MSTINPNTPELLWTSFNEHITGNIIKGLVLFLNNSV